MTSPVSHPLTATAAALNVTCSFDYDGVAFSIYGSTPAEVITGIREIRSASLTTSVGGVGNTPKAEAPGKPSAAPTAPSLPTAEAAPSPLAPSAAAPESKTTATEPAAAAPSAPADDKPFDYTVLQKAVNERVAKFGKDALLAIATKHGAATFKALDPSKWAAAHADVVALG